MDTELCVAANERNRCVEGGEVLFRHGASYRRTVFLHLTRLIC
jgi:hypothetical protein